MTAHTHIVADCALVLVVAVHRRRSVAFRSVPHPPHSSHARIPRPLMPIRPAPAESKSDFTSTLVPSFLSALPHPLAVVEYRLAPLHPHPSQILDVLSALALLASPSPTAPEAGSPKWSRRKLLLVGHSAGAFMALSALLTPPPLAAPLRPEFAVPPGVRAAVAGVVCSEGIYDLPTLLEEYSDYAGFVVDAFGGDGARYARESPARWRLPGQGAEGGARARAVRILVLHSREDELLSLRQPEWFVANVQGLLEEAGTERGTIEFDYDSLRGKHDEVPVRPELPAAVAKWLATIEAAL